MRETREVSIEMVKVDGRHVSLDLIVRAFTQLLRWELLVVVPAAFLVAVGTWKIWVPSYRMGMIDGAMLVLAATVPIQLFNIYRQRLQRHALRSVLGTKSSSTELVPVTCRDGSIR